MTSFKSRIKQAAKTVEDAASDATQAVSDQASQALGSGQDALGGTLNGWASKVGDAAQLAGAATGLMDAASGLMSKGGKGGKGAAASAVEPAEVVVQLGGQTLASTKVTVQRVETRHAVNEIPSATVVLITPHVAHDDDAAFDSLLKQCAVGQTATVKVSKQTVFTGKVGAMEVRVSRESRRIKLRLKPGLQGLKATVRSRIWKPGPDTKVIKEVLNDHQVTASVTLAADEPVQRAQWSCSDWQFVRAVLGQHGAWLWPQADGKVKVQVPKLGGKTHRIAAKPGAGSATVLDIEWKYSGLMQPKGLKVTSWDLAKQTAESKTAKPVTLGDGGLKPASVDALGGVGQALLIGEWEPALEQAAVNGWLAAQHAQAVWATLTLAGYQSYAVGDTLELSGFGTHLNGKALVTRVEVVCDAESRVGKTIVGIGLDEQAAMAPPLPTPSGLVMGKVAKFQADPKKGWNRLPVTVPMLGSEILWARMGHVYASKDSGVTFYPETGDEVALGFVGGDAVIVASLHNPKLSAAIEPSAKNAKKGIVLRHEGKRAELSFDRDKHEATWVVGDDKKPEQQVVVDLAKGVAVTNLKGDVKIDVKEGGASWKTKKTVEFKADEQVTVSGKTGVKVDSDKDVVLDAKDHLTGRGKASVALSSEKGQLSLTPEKATLSANETKVTGTMTVTINGNEAVKAQGAKVSLKGEAEVSVGAPKVAIDGTAEASVKAPIVKVDGEMTDVGGSGITNVKGSLINLG
ncbi:contractile injection system protein, VgrG/Pvc8 family [Burkholderia sp. MS455]|uniref:contractile injection system protein, VgrG/Pvc8 family n=1 Tax=Burkholderia sp. MS455 TaxID=2811788 RepID=UPI001959A33B|nr:contractile injection system protein, VgrG/Pvc8 family [Burkholderia sp. MS455]